MVEGLIRAEGWSLAYPKTPLNPKPDPETGPGHPQRQRSNLNAAAGHPLSQNPINPIDPTLTQYPGGESDRNASGANSARSPTSAPSSGLRARELTWGKAHG